jgi:hypothetical protein
MKKLAFIGFIIIAALLVIPWLTGIAFGHDNSNAAAGNAVDIRPADAAAAPSAAFYGDAICPITPGNLFYADAANSPMDFTATLTITNADELIHSFRYMIFNITISVQDGNGNWVPAQVNNQPLPQTYLTMKNGSVAITLPGGANYKVGVGGGCASCLPYAGDIAIPQFYMEAAIQ